MQYEYVNALPVFCEETGAMRMSFRYNSWPDDQPNAPPEEPVDDRDVTADPRPQPTAAYLLPDMTVFKDRFSLTLSRHVFDGWVSQPSPCCGAASVAGAANAALGLPHDAPAALNTWHVVGLYHAMLSSQAAKKAEAVARLIGVESIEPAIEALRAELHAEGRSLGGRKELGCKAKEAMLRLRALAEDGGGRSDDGRASPDAEAQMWSALWEVLHLVAQGSGAKGGEGCEDGEDEENVLDNNVREGGDGLCGEGNRAHGGCGGGGDGFGVKVRSELKALLNKLSGVEQLAPSVVRPSTWAIGNWGMHSAVRALRGPAFDGENDVYSDADDPRLASLRAEEGARGRAELCSRLRCRTLVQQKCKGQAAPPPIQLRKADDDEAVEAAWAALKAAFSEPHTALILHQKGHYALIYAMREWVEEDETGQPRRVRELLSCRKGQRPTLWIDWTEVHGFITGWSGYAIIEVSAVPAASAA